MMIVEPLAGSAVQFGRIRDCGAVRRHTCCGFCHKDLYPFDFLPSVTAYGTSVATALIKVWFGNGTGHPDMAALALRIMTGSVPTPINLIFFMPQSRNAQVCQVDNFLNSVNFFEQLSTFCALGIRLGSRGGTIGEFFRVVFQFVGSLKAEGETDDGNVARGTTQKMVTHTVRHFYPIDFNALKILTIFEHTPLTRVDRKLKKIRLVPDKCRCGVSFSRTHTECSNSPNGKSKAFHLHKRMPAFVYFAHDFLKGFQPVVDLSALLNLKGITAIGGKGNIFYRFIGSRKGAEGQEGEYHRQRQKGTDKARSG